MRPESAGLALALFTTSLCAAAGSALAEGEAQIAARLKGQPECCIIDARGDLGRLRASIPFAVLLSPTVTVKKGAVALLVADDDAGAIKAARVVATRSEGDVVAVNGGYRTLLALGRATPSASTSASRFTIPSSTCEQGTPLEELKR